MSNHTPKELLKLYWKRSHPKPRVFALIGPPPLRAIMAWGGLRSYVEMIQERTPSAKAWTIEEIDFNDPRI